MSDVSSDSARNIMTKLLLLAPGRAPRLYERALTAEPSFEMVKATIEPLLGLQPMEHVPVTVNGERVDMFVDAESANKGLPKNDEATRVFRNAFIDAYPDTDPNTLPEIYGPVVVTMRRIWFHD